MTDFNNENIKDEKEAESTIHEGIGNGSIKHSKEDLADPDAETSITEKVGTSLPPTDVTQATPSPSAPHLTGMYRRWFLDYASYVILERAVPHIVDGLKPVQRRVLYAMHTMSKDRMTKVAKIVGATMAYHPHGDASITDALVQLGQKGYLIDMQGNWGNILTGDGAAAGRYIEARLSNLAQEILFDDKVTRWTRTYDGAADEPIALPVKFPLLLLQGAEGIAVGLSSKILPHNFNEIIDAACNHLRGEAFELYPDFPTGGLIDVSNYNDGRRGGRIKSRAEIRKIDSRTLSITKLPAGKTTSTLIDSILKANEKGKIKIRHIDDMTSSTADIRIHLAAGVSSDKTIDALFALTDCEVSIAPNACVIDAERPIFTGVSDLLRESVNRTVGLLEQELTHRLGEQRELYLAASLERIFIEERIYKDKDFEEATNEKEAIRHIDLRIEPWKPKLLRTVNDDDLKKLLEIKMARILRFNAPKHEAEMLRLEKEIAELEKNIRGITAYTIRYFEHLKERYGANHPRSSELMRFDVIETSKVVELDRKLYINREEGFVGTTLKDDEYICNCSDLDDFIIFFRDGRYQISKVEEKKFIGKQEVIYIDRYERGNKRMTYNVVYRDGKKGLSYIKRFNATSMIRDREYFLTQETPGSRVLYFSANKNAEAEIIRISLKPKARQRTNHYERDFGSILVKSRTAKGNIVARQEVLKITLKEHGSSTLGARKVWFDPDVRRLNYDERGDFIDSFNSQDRLLVILPSGEYYTTSVDESNHFDPETLRIERYDPNKVWTIVYREAEKESVYLKRFTIEDHSKRVSLIGENATNELLLLSDTVYPRIELIMSDIDRVPLVVEAEEFVSVKGFRAKGKRLTQLQVASATEIEPTRIPEPEETEEKQTLNTPQDQEYSCGARGVERLLFEDDLDDDEAEK